jgi:alkylation response protein AidB-like acyl-CoA dehydrogenase
MSAPAELPRIDDLIDRLLDEHPLPSTPMTEFLGAQYDLGLAWVHFPEGLGGLGMSPKHQPHVNARLFAAGAANPFMLNPMGYGMCGPTVVEWGSEEQKRRYLRPLFTAEEMWCQLFSEPGAGSDVAGLSMTALRDGDEWVLNGQKIWTSSGHLADHIFTLARTDPDAPKHKGISFLLVDMRQPGIEVRPIKMISGESEFNEVFYTDVRVPKENVVGGVNNGWQVANSTLAFEHGMSATTG